MQERQKEYEVKLNQFEGPLDLLLYLINKAEVNIVDICVTEIVTQYIAYLDMIRELNIDVASEYLHMAATLIRLKARELLPPQEGEVIEQEEDGIYNREQLIQQLLEYKKFKEAASTLKVFEAEQFGAFARGKAEVIEHSASADEVDLGNLSIYDLLSAFKKILERVADPQAEYRHVVEVDNVKIDDRIEHILSVLSESEEVPFEELFRGDNRKIVLVVTFMAILELVKMQEIRFRQEENFSAIFVMRRHDKQNFYVTDTQAEQTEDAQSEPLPSVSSYIEPEHTETTETDESTTDESNQQQTEE
ncbi:MAG TPA: segregation/condensation protein A [Chitinispirillaceae bacterium]|nr:segregation/condensation protein A [Chitinispirillaceae bacterium]